MDKLEFSSVDDFEKCVIESLNDFTDDEYPAICVYGKFEFIKETLETLLTNGVKIHNSIELEDCEISGYDKEFELMLTQDGVAVSKMWHEDNEYHEAGYYDTGADVAFVHEDCCSKILSHIECDEIYEVVIGEDCTCNECKCKERESKPASKEKYTVNVKEIDKKTYDKSVKDALERFYEILDKMEEFRKLFYWLIFWTA